MWQRDSGIGNNDKGGSVKTPAIENGLKHGGSSRIVEGGGLQAFLYMENFIPHLWGSY